MVMSRDIYNKKWIIDNSINICDRYEDGILTLRALHYQLVSIGMTNDIQHYKRVVDAMKSARWDGLIGFEKFSDHERSMIGSTDYAETLYHEKVEESKHQIRLWMTTYSKNKWENQENYIEVLIEKKALQGVFDPVCKKLGVGLGACKGYPSLTFLHEMSNRFLDVTATGKGVIIVYFGDYDPSGDDIPRSIQENLEKFGVNVGIDRVALNKDQVLEWKLPSAPVKITDSRTKKWDGIGQVELDSILPEKLQSMCKDAIMNYFDTGLYKDLILQEKEESERFRRELKTFVSEI